MAQLVQRCLTSGRCRITGRRINTQPFELFANKQSLNFHPQCYQSASHSSINLELSVSLGGLIPSLRKGQAGISSVIGQRKTHEDRYAVTELADNVLFLAVYDGHGGMSAVDFTVARLHKSVGQKIAKRSYTDYQLLLAESFKEVNDKLEGFLRTSTGAERYSGTTAVVCLIVDNIHLHVAHVGDSRAYLCRDGIPITLTKDHHPEDLKEKERIVKNGGSIIGNSLGQALVNGRLAMTRSIGDFDLKEFGVTAQPTYTYTKLNHRKDNFLTLVSDGLTSVMSDHDLIETILSHRDSSQIAAEYLNNAALNLRAHDNLTSMVLPLGAWLSEVKITPPKNSNLGFAFGSRD